VVVRRSACAAVLRTSVSTSVVHARPFLQRSAHTEFGFQRGDLRVDGVQGEHRMRLGRIQTEQSGLTLGPPPDG
jgi:hypothetical protein